MISTILSLSLSAVGAWFIYDLIKEFKTFKIEAGRDIGQLKKERENFQNIVRASELTISLRVSELQKFQNEFTAKIGDKIGDFKDDLVAIRDVSQEAAKHARNHAEYLTKSLQLCRHLNDTIKVQQREIDLIKSILRKN